MEKLKPKTTRELIRAYLRQKAYHPSDIKRALAFYDERVADNNNPTNAEVEEVADQGHSEACDVAVPRPVVVEKTIYNEVHETVVNKIAMKTAFIGSFLGTFTALATAAAVLWTLYGMRLG